MFDQIENKAQSQGKDDSARSALHDDAMNSSIRSDESKVAGSNTKPQAALPELDAQKSLTPNAQRQADEAKFFKDMYEKSNFELDPMKKGQGPLQSLEQMEKEGKIHIDHDRMVAEANRIETREKAAGHTSFNPDDHVKLWTEDEIQNKVQQDVAKPKGIDVSNWQGTIDWQQVKNAGYQFAFMKATEGTDFVDHTFNSFREGARDAGLRTGYYHYFHPEDSVQDQVDLFCKTVGKAEPDSLRLVIDAEDPDKWTRYTVDQRVNMVDEFLQGVQNKLGVTPQVSIYCSPNFADKILGNSPKLEKYSLWIANYGVDKPTLPDPWGKWDFWQYTSSGSVPGIKGRVDLDVFNGTDLDQAINKKN